MTVVFRDLQPAYDDLKKQFKELEKEEKDLEPAWNTKTQGSFPCIAKSLKSLSYSKYSEVHCFIKTVKELLCVFL